MNHGVLKLSRWKKLFLSYTDLLFPPTGPKICPPDAEVAVGTVVTPLDWSMNRVIIVHGREGPTFWTISTVKSSDSPRSSLKKWNSQLNSKQKSKSPRWSWLWRHRKRRRRRRHRWQPRLETKFSGPSQPSPVEYASNQKHSVNPAYSVAVMLSVKGVSTPFEPIPIRTWWLVPTVESDRRFPPCSSPLTKLAKLKNKYNRVKRVTVVLNRLLKPLPTTKNDTHQETSRPIDATRPNGKTNQTATSTNRPTHGARQP